jgi:type IV secretory pathway protease TraF
MIFGISLRKYKLLLILVLLSVAVVSLEITLQFPRIGYLNLTNSMPKGIYVVTHLSISQAQYVVIPSSRVLSFGEKLPRYLLKQLIPYHGENVLIDQDGLSLDGKLLAARIKNIGVIFNAKLQPGQVLILGQSERSFDSRYFGPVSTADLTPVRPVITW